MKYKRQFIDPDTYSINTISILCGLLDQLSKLHLNGSALLICIEQNTTTMVCLLPINFQPG